MYIVVLKNTYHHKNYEKMQFKILFLSLEASFVTIFAVKIPHGVIIMRITKQATIFS